MKESYKVQVHLDLVLGFIQRTVSFPQVLLAIMFWSDQYSICEGFANVKKHPKLLVPCPWVKFQWPLNWTLVTTLR